MMSALILTCNQMLKEGKKKTFNFNSKWCLGRHPDVVEARGAFSLVLALNSCTVTQKLGKVLIFRKL